MTSSGQPPSRAGGSSGGPTTRPPVPDRSKKPRKRNSSFIIGHDGDDDYENSSAEESKDTNAASQRTSQHNHSHNPQHGESSDSRKIRTEEQRQQGDVGNDELRQAVRSMLQDSSSCPPTKPAPTHTPAAQSPHQSELRPETSAVSSGTDRRSESLHIRLQLPTADGDRDSPAEASLRRRRGSRVGDTHREDSRVAAERLVRSHTRRLSKPLPPVPLRPSVSRRDQTVVSHPEEEVVNTDTAPSPDTETDSEDYFRYEHRSSSGRGTPEGRMRDEDNGTAQPKFHVGVLSALMRLTAENDNNSSSNFGTPSQANTPAPSAPASPTLPPMRPKFLSRASESMSRIFVPTANPSSSYSNLPLLGGSTAAPTPGTSTPSILPSAKELRRILNPKRDEEQKRKAEKKKRAKARETALITKHIAGVLSRQRYLTRLCRALLQFGAPTHRLEDALLMSARVLGIDCQVLYIPGCMIVSFDDKNTHTAEMQLVREPQGGVDLGKLSDLHGIYKSVVHDRVSADDAAEALEDVMARRPKFNVWFRVFVSGIAASAVGPMAFNGRWIDVPMAFLLGCAVGFLALVAAPRSKEYAHVFEVTAAVLASFFARMLGSVDGGNLFCFPALAQSAIVLLLPGYVVLCASLELQTGSIIAGSVRLVYAMIYTLCLGYGITIGSTLYGVMDKHATSAETCENPLNPSWNHLFVPLLTLCLCILNQARWKQMPVMTIIAYAGFWANYYARIYFRGSAQIASTMGALTVGLLANLLSRLGPHVERQYLKYLNGEFRWWKKPRRQTRTKRSSSIAARSVEKSTVEVDVEAGRCPSVETNETDSGAAQTTEQKASMIGVLIGSGMAAALMIPAIYVQVPGGLAVTGSLLDGIKAANHLTTSNTTNFNTTALNTTTTTQSLSDLSNPENAGVAFKVLFRVIQVAIGITVGLFLSALVVYPFGKRRSALFSF